ncbi:MULTISPECIES: gamma-glutamyltransferase [unclassified Janthinobacterium]|uniref:gamma-glutamyltransferase n=1 Tax=unclassified Janthinobacterium TaxID=2610881 RepID=UPI00160F1C6D|nr:MULTISPECIES: gamma-glutamyltransferase [unclassified Janthinobacterium]MBB5369706.1 gamma-glutamyltranspeptidase/glutathione hydrolase [Janthinobacterium sp. K2C7]MBB5382338.1 gamma-glutamyltranspeptidase/glutathione hydrolase [Janthinobacterium sp. K2Li3]MBB5387915.1 gamma-glutamyltranspeptidase/glutathione hydrolase [Janthinobacterium sp. K2E3]
MIRMKSLALSLSLLGALAASPAFAEVPQKAPEIATAYVEKAGWPAQKFMVAAANPLAADAGYQMLKKGGSAIDAAIATQLVLTLVEPQSSGIGGGSFMLYSTNKGVQAFDGRETAPAAADEHLFQHPDGTPLSRNAAIIGGRSVGAPGVLRMLELAHKEHGKLAWATLFAPAIKLAQNGFPVSQRLNGLLAWDQALKRDPVAAAYFYDKDGKAWPVGHLLKNPELARTLREIARGGADVFYKGRIARDIAAKVAAHPTNPGKLTAADIAGYQAKERDPVCSDYKAWTVCGMPPPSSGGIAIAQMLGILEVKDISPYPPVDGVLDAKAIHLFSEAGRLAYADRDRYVADTDFIPLPGKGVSAMLDKTYLAQRASLIGDKSMGKALPGTPPGMQVAWGLDNALQRPSTSHLVAVDQFGGGLSMTTSVEDAFGSRQMVDGFLLNNQLTDFSFDSQNADGPIANRVQGGKRPRSAMSPTLVFEKGTHKLVLATGSPGGSSIINYVAKVLVGTMDWGLNVQQAISLPNFGSRNGPTELETGRAPEAQIAALRAMGHDVRVIEQNSGLQGIMRLNAHGHDFWFGGADPRREGMVRGD